MDKMDLLINMEVMANWCDDNGLVKEASAIDRMMSKVAGFDKEALHLGKWFITLKNLPVWAKEMHPVLRKIWHAVARVKGNLHLARESYLIGVDGMKLLKESGSDKWRQLWDGLNAYRDALRDLADLRPEIEEFLTHDNEYIANYAHSTLMAVDEILDGRIDDMENILNQIKWH